MIVIQCMPAVLCACVCSYQFIQLKQLHQMSKGCLIQLVFLDKLEDISMTKSKAERREEKRSE